MYNRRKDEYKEIKKRVRNVRFTLSINAPNVRLIDTVNFENFRAGRQHHCYGGLLGRARRAEASPRCLESMSRRSIGLYDRDEDAPGRPALLGIEAPCVN